jgi:hypothetical protein
MKADNKTLPTVEQIWDENFKDWVYAGQIRTQGIIAVKQAIGIYLKALGEDIKENETNLVTKLNIQKIVDNHIANLK